MDKTKQANFEAKRASGKLGGRWRVWEGFQGQPKNKSNYTDTMGMVFPLESLEDVANLMKNTSYGTPSKFFYCIEKEKVKKYFPEGSILEEDGEGYTLKLRKISNSFILFMLFI